MPFEIRVAAICPFRGHIAATWISRRSNALAKFGATCIFTWTISAQIEPLPVSSTKKRMQTRKLAERDVWYNIRIKIANWVIQTWELIVSQAYTLTHFIKTYRSLMVDIESGKLEKCLGYKKKENHNRVASGQKHPEPWIGNQPDLSPAKIAIRLVFLDLWIVPNSLKALPIWVKLRKLAYSCFSVI